MNIKIKQHDTKGLFVDILMLNGVPIDLTGCDVLFLMKKTGLAISQSATIVDAAAGSVSYQPTADDVATAGEFNQEWQVTFPDTSILTVPNGRYNTVTILKDLGP